MLTVGSLVHHTPLSLSLRHLHRSPHPGSFSTDRAHPPPPSFIIDWYYSTALQARRNVLHVQQILYGQTSLLPQPSPSSLQSLQLLLQASRLDLRLLPHLQCCLTSRWFHMSTDDAFPHTSRSSARHSCLEQLEVYTVLSAFSYSI